MTQEEWKKICSDVTAAMKDHTCRFVTPLSTSTDEEVRLVGSGTYVAIGENRLLVTCEHVAREEPMEFRFYGCTSVFRHLKPFIMEPHPIDIAFAPILDQFWTQNSHEAAAIPYERFAPRHQVAQKGELLFFRGYAGENAHYGFGIHETNGTGYCSQEKEPAQPDSQIFEIFWEPENSEFSGGTSENAKPQIRFDDPAGFSGSLVWNTRYLEMTAEGRKWSPEDAVVTGILRRFDPDTKSLLVLRAEHLRNWVEKQL